MELNLITKLYNQVKVSILTGQILLKTSTNWGNININGTVGKRTYCSYKGPLFSS